mmetsp:Transcript_32442/g.77933  ORF Transcript_32442/g.77933 Transcript_32442/m.77933 type:complete len:277 (+) Transcript_32442:54-884(+)
MNAATRRQLPKSHPRDQKGQAHLDLLNAIHWTNPTLRGLRLQAPANAKLPETSQADQKIRTQKNRAKQPRNNILPATKLSTLQFFTPLLGFGRLHSLHQSQPRILHCCKFGFLLCGILLVLGLQLLHFFLELLLHLHELLLLLLDLAGQAVARLSHQLFDLLLLRIITQVDVRWAAHGNQIVLRELLQRCKITPSLVVLQSARVPVLDSRIPLHSDLSAETLPRRGAVYISDKGRARPLVLLHQLVPIRLHALAVPSPRSQELHEHGLPGYRIVPR